MTRKRQKKPGHRPGPEFDEIRTTWRHDLWRSNPTDEWATPRDDAQWDAIATRYLDRDVHPDVIAARDLERLAASWRRTIEHWFVDGADVQGWIDAELGTARTRDIIARLTRDLGKLHRPDRRRRMMVMLLLQELADQGLSAWPDLATLKGRLVEVGAPAKAMGPSDSPPTGLLAEGWVDLHLPVIQVLEALPDEIVDGLARVPKKLLDMLVACWSTEKPGAKRVGSGERSKYNLLEKLLKMDGVTTHPRGS